ncbi:MAG: 50S ribosomal protein L22 [Patescibacteria group bacterium]|jgi:large subunit ribosomal protein L22
MEVKASLKHLRMSTRKLRLVLDVVRGLPAKEALARLQFINKQATEPISKLIESAIANAVNTYDLDPENLYIKEIKADEGVTLKRWMPRAHGRATTIRKRGSHLSVVLAEIVASAKKEKKMVAVEEPVRLDKLAEEGGKLGKKDKVKKETKTVAADSRVSEEKSGAAKGGDKGFSNKMFRRKTG